MTHRLLDLLTTLSLLPCVEACVPWVRGGSREDSFRRRRRSRVGATWRETTESYVSASVLHGPPYVTFHTAPACCW
jgi:hypothetical protein